MQVAILSTFLSIYNIYNNIYNNESMQVAILYTFLCIYNIYNDIYNNESESESDRRLQEQRERRYRGAQRAMSDVGIMVGLTAFVKHCLGNFFQGSRAAAV